MVAGNRDSPNGPGILRFSIGRDDEGLKTIEWRDFLEIFDAQNLAPVIDASGDNATFNRFISRLDSRRHRGVSKGQACGGTMKASAQTAWGRVLGCATLGGLGLGALAVVGLLVLAFPLTLSIVVGSVLVLGVIEWRRRGKIGRAARAGSIPSGDPHGGDPEP